MRRILIALLVIPMTISAVAAAPLVGASIGSASLSSSDQSPSFDLSGHDFAWKLYGGVHFLPFIRLEASYLDLGSVEDTTNGITVKTSSTAWDAFAVGALPLGRLELFAKAGLVYWKSDYDIQGLGSTSHTETDAAYGAGAAFKLAGPFRLRVEYEKFDVKPDVFGSKPSTDLYLISAGLDFRF